MTSSWIPPFDFQNRTLSPTTLRFQKIVREIEADLEEREAALRKKYL
jgi:hypothetical protein